MIGIIQDNAGDNDHQDDKWIASAQDHLLQHLQIFQSLSVQSHVQVKEALVAMCQGLHSNAWEVLRSTHPFQVRYSINNATLRPRV